MITVEVGDARVTLTGTQMHSMDGLSQVDYEQSIEDLLHAAMRAIAAAEGEHAAWLSTALSDLRTKRREMVAMGRRKVQRRNQAERIVENEAHWWHEYLAATWGQKFATVEDGEERFVTHTLFNGLGADWDTEEAIDFIRSAKDVRWGDNPKAQHQLQATDESGRTVHFSVTGPETEES